MTATSLRAPEVIGGNHEHLLVHDRAEILSILGRLRSAREPVSMTIGNGDFVLTMLLAINPQFEEVVLDCGSDPHANRMILRAEKITLVANHEGIKVQFDANGADLSVFEGRPALRVRLPDTVLRLQRREFFRVPARIACEAPADREGGIRILELMVADLSLGGVALSTDKTYVRFEVGEILENCSMSMGSLGTLSVRLRVVSVSWKKLPNGQALTRFGCAFQDLTRQTETLISRFISLKQRERPLTI